ncbi:cilia- and flagella-associated protein 91-like [Cotesia glomerata]|nr:cilia- and flagella-associated protein 91-like [Cotesia glomerata]
MYLCNLTRKNADDLVMPNVRVFDYDSRVMTARNLLSKGTQTDYRDSETQTIPWEPPYKLALGSKEPEVLGLENLSWGSGLPVGTDELKIIKRMRVKKSWESLLPPLDCKVNVQTHKAIITMIDRDEWSFRDKELEMMMDERLEWINKVIKTNNYQRKKKIIQRFEKLGKYLNQLRNKRINEIKRELNREIRKISAKHRNKNSKFIKNPGAKTTDLKDECLFRFKLDDESFYDSLLNRKTLQGELYMFIY